MRSSLTDRELDKFLDDPTLGTVVKTTGNFSQAGLRTGFRITTMNVGDTPTAIPSTALTGRNAISILNKSSEILYIGNSSVEASDNIGTVAGWDVLSGESLNFDVTDSITIYGIAPAGKTIKIKVMELA